MIGCRQKRGSVSEDSYGLNLRCPAGLVVVGVCVCMPAWSGPFLYWSTARSAVRTGTAVIKRKLGHRLDDVVK